MRIGPADLIDRYGDDILAVAREMIRIKAISPKSGGDGESKRADCLSKALSNMGVNADRYDYRDESGAVRSNLVAVLGGIR